MPRIASIMLRRALTWEARGDPSAIIPGKAGVLPCGWLGGASPAALLCEVTMVVPPRKRCSS